MTFTGTGHEDVQKILAEFPRSFTIKDVKDRFGWTSTRARQAMVCGQQADLIRMLYDAHPSTTGRTYAIYEHGSWRKEWITRTWRDNDAGSIMGSGQQRESRPVLSACEGASGARHR